MNTDSGSEEMLLLACLPGTAVQMMFGGMDNALSGRWSLLSAD